MLLQRRPLIDKATREVAGRFPNFATKLRGASLSNNSRDWNLKRVR